MNLLKSVIDEIYDLLIENNINEIIDLRISNLEDYDYQINNLVKYRKHIYIEQIKEKISNHKKNFFNRIFYSYLIVCKAYFNIYMKYLHKIFI